MFFTPFSFVQQPYAVSVVPSAFPKYYAGGAFTAYSDFSQRYFRMLDSTGYISSSFNIGAGFNGAVYTNVTQSDGKIVLGGNFTTYSGSASITRIARLNTDGTRDTTPNFGTGFNGTSGIFNLQSDGKIVAGGGFTTYSGSTSNRIVRINTNGIKDTTFNIGTGFDNNVFTLTIQSDGKIVAGGQFTTYSGSAKGDIARLNTDGTADTGSSWDQGVGFNSTVYSVALQSDEKVIVGGAFTTYSGSTSINRIVRLNTNGTRDTTFNPGTAGANSTISAVAIQPDGKIIAGGAFTSYSGSSINRLIRINTNGTKDTTFNVGTGFDGTVQTTILQPDGKILLSGQFANYSGSVVNGITRLNTDGTIDSTFNPNLSINSSTIIGNNSVLPLSNGSIILGGTYTGDKVGYVTSFDNLGSPNAQSTVGSYGFNATTNAIIQQSNGKLLVGGNFTIYSGSTVNYAVSLNSDGTIDSGSTWNQGTGFSSTVQCFTTQSDGKILVGGAFTSYSGSANRTRILRLNTNGTLDTTFNPGTTGANSTVNSIAVQADGKILIGGGFNQYSGSTKYYLVRANTNGTIDTDFNTGALVAINSTVSTVAVQSDQKIIAGGSFTTYSGSTKNYIARINPNGTADTGSSWNQGTGFGSTVLTTAIQPDGKILAGGTFTTYSGSTANRIARLNTDGTADTGSSWNQGTGLNNAAYALTVESGSGRILVGGDFTTYSGSTANRIVCLNSDGTIDTTFTLSGSGGFNSTVRVITPY